MSTTPTVFTGSSAFSADLQGVLSRAVEIRALGLASLSAESARILAQNAAVGALDAAFANLQNAVTAIRNSTGTASLSTAVSTAGFVLPTLSEGALPGLYSIEVTNLGAATSTVSKDGQILVSDPSSQNISAGATFTLTVNGVDTIITPAATNLNSLVTAINSNTALNVQASIVNVGPPGSPDYRLALQSTKLGANTIQLSSGATPLLDTLSTGAAATYKVNGLATNIESDSRTVTIAPGLSVTLQQQSPAGVASTITVSKSVTAASNALAAFAVSYNAAMKEIANHRGSSGGALAGQSLLSTLEQTLRNIASYSSGSESFPNLTSLGFSFDKNGVLSFDSAAFGAATSGNTTALYTLLGDNATGFIQHANAALAAVEDPVYGTIKTTMTSLTAMAARQDKLIAEEQARVDQFRADMTNRISAADALIAALQQKVNFLTGLFTSMTNPNNSYNS